MQPSPKAPIEVQLVGTDFLDIVHAKDISTGGVAIKVPHAFADCQIDGEVEIIVTLPGQKSFVARGIIRHKGPRGVQSFGVQFTEIADSDRERVRVYVERRLEALSGGPPIASQRSVAQGSAR